ncbi:unnamed protein product [Ostreobium quekettii]|uniref:Uncharacterized protein n=1 Tax=Ostreobium quekettii TaxID=121088 RepID=A0A8S1IX33_9CHLO|nr:unnamed protein product [Ostreobium quekettii]|eukprot:evm.model.scf_87.6 EVM.evm.TU.scf_87.6   scf_87:102690-105035(-)
MALFRHQYQCPCSCEIRSLFIDHLLTQIFIIAICPRLQCPDSHPCCAARPAHLPQTHWQPGRWACLPGHATPSSANGAGGEALPTATYNSGDGRAKTTLEQVFRGEGSTRRVQELEPPWQLGWQMNERNLMWNEGLKLRLVMKIASEELGMEEDHFQRQLEVMQQLLPGFGPRVATMPPKLIAALVGIAPEVATKLVELKSMLPEADVSSLCLQRPSLLLDADLAALRRDVDRLRRLLPRTDVDALVERHPVVLDVPGFEEAMADVRRMMGEGTDVEELLARNPDIILALQKGEDMIPYDPVP